MLTFFSIFYLPNILGQLWKENLSV
uniref:Uncharacterized protein n=1 Tax=Anguilla anguilla TaxID=7936 RepID=A0A0E9SUK4_ANGAN